MKKIVAIVVLSLSLFACAVRSPIPPMSERNVGGASPALTPLTFMAGYKPQANLPFVGAYVAKEKGFFQQQGLDVTIEHSAGRGEHVQLLTAGTVQVTTMDAATLLQRRADPGLPIVSIALIGQRGQQAFAALAESGIKTPADWRGKTVGYKGAPPPDLYALLAAANVDVNAVRLVNVGFDPRVLTEKQVDVYPLFKSNEPWLLKSWGYEIVLWDAADYGVPTLGLAYVTSEAYLRDNADLLARFLRAALQGIAYAQDNPDEAVQIVLRYAGPETNPDHMRYMLQTELRDAQTEQGVGWQSLAQWQALAEMLIRHQALPAGLDVARAFDTRIWEAVHR
ncbi:MAG: ABC transporter substrate-binding protein [Anaerolineae bacterium]|nr:ABC transporter substrate-binding protein [Thermoflexales bacterium]MDW8407216.1 ABC transporter substrate-binding protein [Anaerolineae bacterium]